MAHSLTPTLSVFFLFTLFFIFFLFFLTTHSNNYKQQQNYKQLAQQQARGSTPLDHICCTNNKICLLLHRRLLHFTSIRFAFLVATDKTREAMSHRQNPLPLDPSVAAWPARSDPWLFFQRNRDRDSRHQVLQAYNFFNFVSVYIYIFYDSQWKVEMD